MICLSRKKCVGSYQTISYQVHNYFDRDAHICLPRPFDKLPSLKVYFENGWEFQGGLRPVDIFYYSDK